MCYTPATDFCSRLSFYNHWQKHRFLDTATVLQGGYIHIYNNILFYLLNIYLCLHVYIYYLFNRNNNNNNRYGIEIIEKIGATKVLQLKFYTAY